MYDPLFVEMFDESESPAPTPGRTAISPLDDPLFQFQRSTGAAELLAAQLEARHLAEELLGTETFSKRIREGLIDLTPVTIRQPISTNTFEQQPLPTPEQLCTCSCPACRQQHDCKNCSAETKCDFHPSRSPEAHKAAIARIVAEAKGRLHSYAGSDKAAWNRTWKGVESSMVRFVADAVSSAV